MCLLWSKLQIHNTYLFSKYSTKSISLCQWINCKDFSEILIPCLPHPPSQPESTGVYPQQPRFSMPSERSGSYPLPLFPTLILHFHCSGGQKRSGLCLQKAGVRTVYGGIMDMDKGCSKIILLGRLLEVFPQIPGHGQIFILMQILRAAGTKSQHHAARRPAKVSAQDFKMSP